MKMNFKKIKDLRVALGMNQRDLSCLLSRHTKTKISFMSISQWERGLHVPSAENIAAICEVFCVGVNYFKK
jgi:transcriptional regulator with XRE-family HTH domain